MADDLNDVTDDETNESSEAQIAVHWREEDYYEPPAALTAQANASDPAIREQFTEDKFPDCFTAYADLLTWYKPWDTVLDTSNAPFWPINAPKLWPSRNSITRYGRLQACPVPYIAIRLGCLRRAASTYS